MKYILLIAAFHAIFFAILLLQKKPKALHDNILVYWLIYLGLFTGSYAFYSHNLFVRFPLLSSSFISLFMLHGPFLFLYISALSTKEHSLKLKYLMHFAPFICFNLYLIVASFFPGVTDRIRMDHVSRDIEPPTLFLFFLILTALSGPLYFVLSFKLFKKLDISIFNNFSFSENINLDWLRKLVWIFGILWTVLMVIAVIHHVFHLFSMTFCTDGLFISLSAFIILVGYFGLKQQEIFSHYRIKNQEYITEPKIKYAGSSLKVADANHYLEKLNSRMASEKPHLDPNLTLPQLANDLGIPSHYLSQIINENFGLNFFDFINQFRVEEVKTKIVDPEFDSYSLLGIAFECGFNSKSAFNRIFKKSTGLTPSEYKRMQSN
jgi:AraC-like DNA-binding protein